LVDDKMITYGRIIDLVTVQHQMRSMFVKMNSRFEM